MCGIGGILRFDDAPVETNRLDRMADVLSPRGPDGHGKSVDRRCGLVHTRLAVIDIAGGTQPMRSVGGCCETSCGKTSGGAPGSSGGNSESISVVFNGEIYNHRQLRTQLQGLGHRFITDHSDTEVLLHGYKQWGADLPQRLDGMFAFAVWDPRKGELFIARDRFGKKPVYYFKNQTQFAFGSLVGAVLCALDNIPPINKAALSEYLTFGYLVDNSMLCGIEQLPAGCWMIVKQDGSLKQYCYCPRPRKLEDAEFPGAGLKLPGAPQEVHSLPPGVADIEKLISDAVGKRLEADVPLGCFLSGGIDSSLIAAIAQKQLLARGQRLKTFTVSMPDARYDEGPFAKCVADHIASDHHQLVAEPHIEEDLKMLIATVGGPFGDSSILPTYWLSRATRQHVTVALSGDGGDELFAGYDRYRAMRILTRHSWWLKKLPIGLMRGVLGGGGQKTLRSKLRRLVEAARAGSTSGGEQYLSMVRLFSDQQIQQLGIAGGISGGFMDGFNASGGGGTSRSVGGKTSGGADAARLWDIKNYLPGDLLTKVDRASMAVALEVRCPLLDGQLADTVSQLPIEVLCTPAPGSKSKALLKNIAAAYLPQNIITRPKMGFAVPIGSWFATDLHDMLCSYLLDGPWLDNLGCDKGFVEQLVRQHVTGRSDHTHRLFSLLTLAMWGQWLEDISSDKLSG